MHRSNLSLSNCSSFTFSSVSLKICLFKLLWEIANLIPYIWGSSIVAVPKRHILTWKPSYHVRQSLSFDMHSAQTGEKVNLTEKVYQKTEIMFCPDHPCCSSATWICTSYVYVHHMCLNTVSQLCILFTSCPEKNGAAILLPVTSPNANRFSKYFISGLSGKFVIKLQLKIPPHLTNIATLPCETLMSENSDNLKHL